MAEKLLLSVEEVAQLLGLSPYTVYKWSAAGRIPAVKLGTRILFSPEDIDRWIDRHTRPAGQQSPPRTTPERVDPCVPKCPRHP